MREVAESSDEVCACVGGVRRQYNRGWGLLSEQNSVNFVGCLLFWAPPLKTRPCKHEYQKILDIKFKKKKERRKAQMRQFLVFYLAARLAGVCLCFLNLIS